MYRVHNYTDLSKELRVIPIFMEQEIIAMARRKGHYTVKKIQ